MFWEQWPVHVQTPKLKDQSLTRATTTIRPAASIQKEATITAAMTNKSQGDQEQLQHIATSQEEGEENKDRLAMKSKLA